MVNRYVKQHKKEGETIHLYGPGRSFQVANVGLVSEVGAPEIGQANATALLTDAPLEKQEI